ncbi:hypothetical protein EJ04DRAFT_527320 [Polyplosphaeria fusca]|uniref:NACHT domain-containing protein n=1 Tax=Polyplosphaeria fusca TaxID=682080 RepID=A0A9P4QQW5_9PLEO|nr:hypothetical protein EJ04DRAFT_527320 [Polyplosphaeria fusca]
MAHTPDPFVNARDSFLNSLGPKERSIFATCSSLDELMKDAKKTVETLRPRGHGDSLLTNIAKFGHSLKKYFDIVGIMVQSKPEVAAIVWGAIRLALQLSANYASFFSSFIDCLDKITANLPLVELCSDCLASLLPDGLSKRLEVALTEIYCDFFRFLQSVIRIFTRKDGNISKMPVVAGKLFWKPFDERYKETLDRILLQGKVISNEIKLSQWRYQLAKDEDQLTKDKEFLERMRAVAKQLDVAKEAIRALDKKQQTYERHENVRHIQSWLKPPDFYRDFDRACRLRAPGTASWIFELVCFQDWRNVAVPITSCGRNKNEVDTILLVKGCGKTVLAAATINNIKASAGNRQVDVYYFFFRAGYLEHRLDAYCALLTQVLLRFEQHEDLMEKFGFAMRSNPSGELNRPTEHAAFELLVVCCGLMVREGFIILDAIDECVDSTALVEDLYELSQRTGIKVLLFSRPNLKALYEKSSPKREIFVGRSTVPDIQVFLGKGLQDLQENHLLPQSYDKTAALERLVKSAEGMFLWAQLMVTYLRIRAFTPRQRLDMIMSFGHPEGLDAMYDRISEMIYSQTTIERNMAKRMLAWIAFSRYPLTAEDLETAINVGNGTIDIESDGRIHGFCEAVVTICGGVVEIVNLKSPHYGESIRTFQFIHLSAKEYFIHDSPNTIGHIVSIPSQVFLRASSAVANLDIARTCLITLLNAAPGKPLRPEENKRSFNVVSFVYYAATSWIQHLKQAGGNNDGYNLEATQSKELDQVLGTFDEFISQPDAVTAWIEVAYSIPHRPEISDLLHCFDRLQLSYARLCKRMDDFNKLHRTTVLFSNEMQKLDEMWGCNLVQVPGCIWDEVPAFMQSRILASSLHTETTEISSDSAEKEQPARISKTPLSKISFSNEEGDRIAVLSVWPSQAYEQMTELSSPTGQEMRNFCRDWYAQIELWEADKVPNPLHQIWMPLEPEEVEIHMAQSLSFTYIVECQGLAMVKKFVWTLQFPMVISPKLDTIVVLRTMHQVRHKEEGLTIVSSKLPMEAINTKNIHWKFPPDPPFTFCRHVPGYKYWVSLSTDNRFCGVFDYDIDRDQNTLAVFRTEDLFDGIGSRPTSLVTCRSFLGLTSDSSPRILFHPDANIMVVAFNAGGPKVFIWAFELGITIDLNAANGCYPENACMLSGDKEVSFSQCGEYLVLVTKTGLPIIQPIPKKVLYYGRYYATTTAGPNVHQNSNAVMTEKNLSHALMASPGQALATSSQLLDPRTGRGITVAQHGSRLELQAWSRDHENQTESRVELLRVPRSAGFGNSIAMIHLPKDRDERLKVILNMAARPWNSLGVHTGLKSPIVVHRELSGIAQGRTTWRGLLSGNGERAYAKNDDRRLLAVEGKDDALARDDPNHRPLIKGYGIETNNGKSLAINDTDDLLIWENRDQDFGDEFWVMRVNRVIQRYRMIKGSSYIAPDVLMLRFQT